MEPIQVKLKVISCQPCSIFVIFIPSRSPSWSSLYHTVKNRYLSHILASSSCSLTFQIFEKWKRGLFHITKRAIIEQASTEQNQSQVNLSLLLVHHNFYSKLRGDGLSLCFKSWITLPSISRITGDSRRKNCISCRSSSLSGRYVGCQCRSLGCQMWR